MDIHDLDLFYSKQTALESFAEKHQYEEGVEVLYYDSFGKFPCLRVTLGHYLFEMDFRPQEDAARNEIRTMMYFTSSEDTRQRTRRFMIKRETVPSDLQVFARTRSNYHFLPVSLSDWAEEMISTVSAVRSNPEAFLRMCRLSCPFNEDGTHKFKSWKNFAKVRITREENNPVVQGLKGGEVPSGSHVVGGNGSFRVFNKGEYGIEYTVERIAGEEPRRGVPHFVGADEYLRGLMTRLGRQRMPYDMLNSKLPQRLEVITYDMNLDPYQREFVPVGYSESWQQFLEECFKDL